MILLLQFFFEIKKKQRCMMFYNEIFGVFLFNKEIKNILFCYVYDFSINFYWRGMLTDS